MIACTIWLNLYPCLPIFDNCIEIKEFLQKVVLLCFVLLIFFLKVLKLQSQKAFGINEDLLWLQAAAVMSKEAVAQLRSTLYIYFFPTAARSLSLLYDERSRPAAAADV